MNTSVTDKPEFGWQGAPKERDEGQTIIRVFQDTMHQATCRKCHAPVLWAQVARTRKWILFNFPPDNRGDTLDRDTDRPCKYLAHDDVHWNSCSAD